MNIKEIILFGAVAAATLVGPVIPRDGGTTLIGTQAQASEDRRIVVINHTKKRIVGLYASPIDQKNWTFNMLSTVSPPFIYAGDKIVADFNDQSGYCRMDLKAVDAAGRVAVHMDVNVCVLETWDIYPGD